MSAPDWVWDNMPTGRCPECDYTDAEWSAGFFGREWRLFCPRCSAFVSIVLLVQSAAAFDEQTTPSPAASAPEERD